MPEYFDAHNINEQTEAKNALIEKLLKEQKVKSEEKLANLITDHITPQLISEIEFIPWRNIYLLAIQIFPSSTKPHYLKQEDIEKACIRVGSTNRRADQPMLAELQRVRIEDSFDKQPMPALNSEAIDFRVASELFSSV